MAIAFAVHPPPAPRPQRMPLPRETKASQGHNITLKPPVKDGPLVRPFRLAWDGDEFVRVGALGGGAFAIQP